MATSSLNHLRSKITQTKTIRRIITIVELVDAGWDGGPVVSRMEPDAPLARRALEALRGPHDLLRIIAQISIVADAAAAQLVEDGAAGAISGAGDLDAFFLEATNFVNLATAIAVAVAGELTGNKGTPGDDDPLLLRRKLVLKDYRPLVQLLRISGVALAAIGIVGLLL